MKGCLNIWAVVMLGGPVLLLPGFVFHGPDPAYPGPSDYFNWAFWTSCAIWWAILITGFAFWVRAQARRG